MSDSLENGVGALDTLAAWREQGADRLDPVRFHFIEALARRTATRSGVARRVLDEKLARLLDAYGRDLDIASVPGRPDTDAMPGMDAGPAADATPVANPASGANVAADTLADLLDNLAARAQAHAGTQDGDAAGGAGQPVYPDLALLDYFRDVWSRYSAKRQLKQSQERVPENAGPLNSSLLVHRMLSLMGEVSPEYLQHFLSYVDALAWTEQATGGDFLNKDAQRANGARRPRSGSR